MPPEDRTRTRTHTTLAKECTAWGLLLGLGFREGGLQHEAEGVAALTAKPAASLQPSFRGKYRSWEAQF